MRKIFTEGIEDKRIKKYLMPKKILWQNGDLENPMSLMKEKPLQVPLKNSDFCAMKPGSSLLFDFGSEIHGGLMLTIQSCVSPTKQGKMHIRFGESAMECMTELLGEKNATNDHAQRDFDLTVSTLGSIEIGNTGFRFVRIDCPEITINLDIIRAIFIYQDVEYTGSFKSDDERLNEVWETAAYTVHLNMQNFLWDGIKRDRLVWIGDMHPETSTIQKVFGFNECVPRSLDFTKECFAPNEWMNNIPSYTMWWIKIQYDWYMQNGDLDYLMQQKDYLYAALDHLFECINEDGSVSIDKHFIDWPTSPDPKGAYAGMHAILILALDAAANICSEYKDKEMSVKCSKYVELLKKSAPNPGSCKQAAALQSLAGVSDYEKVNDEILSVDPFRNLSTFLGYYILKARGEAGDIDGTIDLMNTFWGKMLDLGATTFFEDFNLDWVKGAKNLDEFVAEGENDIHGDHGDYCYKGFRHSLCHGWASGPAAYIQEYILGVKVLAPGCKKVSVRPNLGTKLNKVEGSYPTPYGKIQIKAQRINGEVEVLIEKPSEVIIVD
ncbi:MAG: alpha-L-rhamnosidase C-terminal domain-containing protein [Bacillota bacterium]|nr:alpha-L-rhamnosidase C-terminal domain-containing protein [Bacillota bacterium]